MQLRSWYADLAVAIALSALVAWSAWNRWLLLGDTPFPVGIDGYFYPVQLRSILEHGHLAYAASPLAFWLLAPFAWLTDPITGAKLGAAVLGAAIALPAYGVGRRLGGSRAAGLLAAALITPSAGSFYLSVEFVKNGIGLTVAMTYVWLMLRALDAPSRGRIVAAALALVAAYLTHKMAAGLALLVTVPAVATAAWPRIADEPVVDPERAAAARRDLRRGVWRMIGGAVCVVAGATGELALRGTDSPLALVAFGVLLVGFGAYTIVRDRSLPRRRARFLVGLVATPVVLVGVLLALAALFPGRVIGEHDLALVTDLFSSRADWDDPALVLGQHVLWMGHEVQIAAALAFLLAAGLIVRVFVPRESPVPAPAIAVAITLAALALVIAVPWIDVRDAQGLGFRLRVAAFVPMGLVAAAMVGQLGVLVPREIRVIVPIAFALVWVVTQPTERDEGVVRTHPALALGAQALARELPPDAIVVCPERHIVFMAAWYTGADVRLRPEAVPSERMWRLLPLAFIGKDSALDHALLRARDQPGLVAPVGLHPRHPDGLVILPEATWDWVVDQLPPDGQARLRRWHTI